MAKVFTQASSRTRGIFFGSSRFRLGWILVTLGVLNGLFWTVHRWNYENHFNTVQLTVDYEDTRVLADAYQVPHLQLLKELKARGVSSVGVYEQSIGNLRDRGRIALTPREEAERLYPNFNWASIPTSYRYLISATRENQALLPALFKRMQEQGQTYPTLRPREVVLQPDIGFIVTDGHEKNLSAPKLTGILIPVSPELIGDAQMGFDPTHIALIKKAGLGVTARVSNSLNTNLARVNQLLDDAKATGAHVVIFSEDEVLGYDSIMAQTARATRERGLLFGNIEFTKQRGWVDFAKQSDGLLARVHSVGGDEAAKVKTELLVDRYVRAAKERNIRVAYIRLIRQFKGEYPALVPGTIQTQEQLARAEKTPLQQNLDFIQTVSDELQKQPVRGMAWLRPGLQMGDAPAFNDYPVSALTPAVGEKGAKIAAYLGRLLAGIGGVGMALLMLNLFFDLSPRAKKLWFWAGAFIVAMLALSSGKGTQLIALEVGCFCSVIGILWGGLPELLDNEARAGRENIHAKLPVMQAFKSGSLVLFKTSLLTTLGGILVIALLNNWKYMSKADEFLGEKGTLLFPILATALILFGQVYPHRVAQEGAAPARQRALTRARNLLAQPFTVQVAAGLAVVAIAGFFFIARTGNDSGMEISSFEWNMRALLERIFLTRPRTKEIFLGHPAMIFAAYFALRRQWLPAVAATLCVSIGQGDLLNTFCHIHTPIFYSLWRSIVSIVVGALIGGLGVWLWSRIENRARQIKPATPRPYIVGENGSNGSNGHVSIEVPVEGAR